MKPLDFRLESRPCPKCGAAMLYDEGEPWDGPTWGCTGCGHSENATKHTEAQRSARVHALVNDGPWPEMSESFDAHMGAACWTDPAYRQDAATWAAAWKAALRAKS